MKKAIALALAVALTGCTSVQTFAKRTFGSEAYHGATFYRGISNAAISQVWDDGASTFVLPARGYAIDEIRTTAGLTLVIDSSSSYFKVSGAFDSIDIRVNGFMVKAIK